MSGLRLIFALVLSVTAGSACTNDDQPPTAGDGDGPTGGDAGGDPVPGDEPPPRHCRGTAPFIRVANAQTLSPLEEYPSQCLIYGADVTGSEVYIIDTATDVVAHVIAVGASPTDLTLSADRRYLYVAVFGESKIVVLDALDGSLVKEVPITTTDTAGNPIRPYKIARAPGFRLYYVEEDALSAIYHVNLNTEVVTQLTEVDLYEPDLEATADGSALYVGEANAPIGGKLLKFETTADFVESDRYALSEGGFILPSPKRQLVLAEAANRIFFADRSFEADDFDRMLGWTRDQVVAATADGAILATDEFLYDGVTFVRFANRPHPDSGALFSEDGAWLYEFSGEGSLLYRTAVDTLVGVHDLGETNVPPGSLAQHRFNQMLADPIRPVIYALDAQQNQIIFIDRDTLLPTRAEIIGSSPTDMSISSDGEEMVVATFGATSIAVLDLTNEQKALKATLPVPGNPFRVALGSSRLLVYAEQDQYTDVTLVDFDSGQVLDNVASTVFQPDIDFDTTGGYLFAGESAGPTTHLRRFDLEFDTLEEVAVSASTYSYPLRKVIFHAGFVYFAGHKFDATTLAQIGSFGEDIMLVTPNGQYAVSRRQIYSTTEFRPNSTEFLPIEGYGLPVDSGVLACDPAGGFLYQFDNDTGALFVQALPSG